MMGSDLGVAAAEADPAHPGLDDRRWTAVLSRDSSFDGRFVFAVRSTMIYCRPSCAARRPRRDRTLFFARPQDAEAAGFRPCRRCEPRVFADAQAKRRLDGELALARAVQERLAPASMPRRRGWDVAGTAEPCREVGGDFFDVVEAPSGGLALALGDVAGKGVGAALLAASLQTAFRLTAAREAHPGRVLAALNADLHGRAPLGVYATLAVVVLHADGRLRSSVAGHPGPLVVDGPVPVRSLDAGGPPLGLFAGAVYRGEETRLGPSGAVLLYSDGVSEATDEMGRELGSGFLHHALAMGTGGPAGVRLEELRLRLLARATGPASDDRTLLLACRDAAAPGRERGPESTFPPS